MQSRSHFLRHEQCPACAAKGRDRKKNNLGVYSDGGTYCYSCGFGTNASTEARLSQSKKEHKEIPALPEDITNKLGREAYEWLLQYFEPANFPRCLYSRSERKLYFILDNGAYQYRYFGDNKDHPKWVGYGINENLLHITGMGTDSIVLVEDLISGTKVGHITPTLTLFGSNISLKKLATIKLLGYKEVIIWLDWDKKEYAIKAAQSAQSIGLLARVIHTKLDPKDYTYLEIERILHAHT